MIDEEFAENSRTIMTMREDIENTLKFTNHIPDSILILSTASPDGGVEFNKRLARDRAANTEKLLLSIFPQFEKSNIRVEYLEEDLDGLKQVLKADQNFPQREEMLAVIESDLHPDQKEWALRQCKEGWRTLVSKYIYTLRNSSITISVIGKIDEYTIAEIKRDTIPSIEALTYVPAFEQKFAKIDITRELTQQKYRKTILALRSNLLVPAHNIGLEIPMGNHWSVGADYFFPWYVSERNQWCVEMLGLFMDVKYWFTSGRNEWSADSKLKGHALGLYGGVGYYDFQNKEQGAQGEYVDFGIDYTYALPVAKDKLRLEFNLGVGLIKTWYRPYNPSSDYSDLIKEPGVKYRSSNFVGPTRASISLVWPIHAKVKRNPDQKKINKAGGER